MDTIKNKEISYKNAEGYKRFVLCRYYKCVTIRNGLLQRIKILAI